LSTVALTRADGSHRRPEDSKIRRRNEEECAGPNAGLGRRLAQELGSKIQAPYDPSGVCIFDPSSSAPREAQSGQLTLPPIHAVIADRL
jgi:hypothetical protein